MIFIQAGQQKTTFCVAVCYEFCNLCFLLSATESKQTYCKEIITNGWAALPYKVSAYSKGAGDLYFLSFCFPVLFY
jgi:hypothetical protein